MAKQQGHPGEVDRALGNLGYTIPWADEENGKALAQRVRISQATTASIVADLERALGSPLSDERKERVVAEFRRASEDLQQARGTFLAQVAQSAGASADQLEDIARTDSLGSPLADRQFLDDLQGILGRSLNARELEEIAVADAARLADADRVDQKYAERLARIIGFKAPRGR